MKWKGIAIGGCLGALYGGPLGALFGAVFGNRIEEKFAYRKRSRLHPKNPQSDLDNAYATLGVSSSASFEEIRAKYHKLAKKYHPDTMRAKGLPEEAINIASEKMSRISAAWARIQHAR